jgi:hypothetical protein
VFYNTHGTTTNWATSGKLYLNNLYYGANPPSSDSAAIKADPLFAGVPAFGTGTSAATRYDDFSLLRPTAFSPMINSGIVVNPPDSTKMNSTAQIISNIPGNVPDNKDYAGVTLSGKIDIGIFAADFTGLAGIVTDTLLESPIEGAIVEMIPSGGGETLTDTTGQDGGYSFPVGPTGSYTIRVEAENFADSTVSFEANADALPRLPLSTGEYTGNLIRTVTGTITDIVSGQVLEGATVTFTKGGLIRATVYTDSSGVFTADVAPGSGYTITASLEGCETKSISFTIPVNGDVPPADIALVSTDRVYYDEPFDTLDDWTASTSGASTIDIIQDPDDPLNKLLRIYKTTGSHLASVYNKTHANAYGTFTIETRMKRSATGAAIQYELYTYDSEVFEPGAHNKPATSFMFESGQFKAHVGTVWTPFKPYTVNTWYSIVMRVNTAAQEFDLYLDGVKIISGAGYRNPTNEIDIFEIGSGTSGSNFGYFYVDYIKVYQGEPKNLVRKLEPGPSLTVDGDADGAAVTFTGADGLSLSASDFTVTGGASVSSVGVTGDTATVTVTFAANQSTTTANTYTVGMNQAGTVTGDGTVTITQNPLTVYKNISGTVKDSSQTPIEDASVTISKAGTTPISALTDSTGAYTLTGAASGSGYTITASKEGYIDRSVADYEVPGGATPAETVDFVLPSVTSYLFFEEFDSLAAWTATSPSGTTIEIVADPDSPGNNLLHMKTTVNNAAFGIYNKTNANATGIFTIEMRMKRSTITTVTQYHMYSYDSSQFTSGSGTNSAANVGMNGGQFITHNGNTTAVNVQAYTANVWYTVALRVDTSTKKFDFYIDGTKVLSDAGFRTSTIATIDKFNIWSGTASSSRGEFWVDYLKVYAGDPQ